MNWHNKSKSKRGQTQKPRARGPASVHPEVEPLGQKFPDAGAAQAANQDLIQDYKDTFEAELTNQRPMYPCPQHD